jgi:hypothetical protein
MLLCLLHPVSLFPFFFFIFLFFMMMFDLQYAHAHVAVDTFGVSAPEKDAFAHFGFTKESVADKARKLVAFYPAGAPSLNRPTF